MRRSPIVWLAAGMLVLAGCGDPDAAPAATDAATTAPTSAAAPGAPTTAAASTDAAVPEALQFSAPLVDGSDLDFRGFAGETVALWFWAPT